MGFSPLFSVLVMDYSLASVHIHGVSPPQVLNVDSTLNYKQCFKSLLSSVIIPLLKQSTYLVPVLQKLRSSNVRSFNVSLLLSIDLVFLMKIKTLN